MSKRGIFVLLSFLGTLNFVFGSSMLLLAVWRWLVVGDGSGASTAALFGTVLLAISVVFNLVTNSVTR